MTLQISADSLRLRNVRQPIKADNVHNEVQLVTSRELNARFREDRKIWRSGRYLEMERDATVGNSNMPFHLIQYTGRKALGVNDAISEANVHMSTTYNAVL